MFYTKLYFKYTANALPIQKKNVINEGVSMPDSLHKIPKSSPQASELNNRLVPHE